MTLSSDSENLIKEIRKALIKITKNYKESKDQLHIVDKTCTEQITKMEKRKVLLFNLTSNLPQPTAIERSLQWTMAEQIEMLVQSSESFFSAKLGDMVRRIYELEDIKAIF